MRLIDAEKLKDEIAVLFERNEDLIDDTLACCVDDIIDAQQTLNGLESYQRGYEDGFREGRTRRELSEKQN